MMIFDDEVKILCWVCLCWWLCVCDVVEFVGVEGLWVGVVIFELGWVWVFVLG